MGRARAEPAFKPAVGWVSSQKEDGPAQTNPNASSEYYESYPIRLIGISQNRPLQWQAKESEKKDAAQANAAIQRDSRACFSYSSGSKTGDIKHARQVVACGTWKKRCEKSPDRHNANQ